MTNKCDVTYACKYDCMIYKNVFIDIRLHAYYIFIDYLDKLNKIKYIKY